MDWFISIPGTSFLIGYIVFIGVCLFGFGLVVRNGDGRYIPPDPNRFDLIAFAVLRGGWRAAVDTAVVQLMARQIIKTEATAGKQQLSVQAVTSDLSPIEKVIYEYVMVPKGTLNFYSRQLRRSAEAVLKPMYQEWIEQGLLLSRSSYALARAIIWLSFLLGGGLAIAKAVVGVARHQPTAFLIDAIVFITTVYLLFCFPVNRLTRGGRRYISEVVRQFSWLKDQLKTDDVPTMNYVLGIAILGNGALASSAAFSQYRMFSYHWDSRGRWVGAGIWLHSYLAFGSRSASDRSNGGCGGGCGDGGGGGCSGGCGCGGCGGGD